MLQREMSCICIRLIMYITYIYIYICNHENNVPSQLSPQLHCGNSCTWAHDETVQTVNHVPKCISCHKVIVVITGRTHCSVCVVEDHGSFMTTIYICVCVCVCVHLCVCVRMLDKLNEGLCPNK